MKFRKLLAALAALTLLAGCGDKTSSSENASSASESSSQSADASSSESNSGKTAEEYAALSEDLIKSLSEGDVKPLTELFSADVKKQIKDEDITGLWDQIQAEDGKFTGIGETETEDEKSMVTTATTLHFEKKDYILNIVYGKSGKIMGLFINDAEAETDEDEEIVPEETDAFAEKEVKVGEYDLDGLLCVPKNAEKPPLVLLVWGSGQCNMNEGGSDSGTFYELSRGLAENGVATLRFNKRLYQFPDMINNDVTVEDEYLEDTDAAVKLAQAYVDRGEFSGVYILGHSQGGSLVPSIAQRNSEVKGFISLAGTPRRMIDVWLEQLNAQLDMFEDEDTRNCLTALIDQVETMRDKHELKETDNPEAYQIFFGVPYWDYLDKIKPDEIADGLDIPMLFLQGDSDVQVYPDKDFPAWKEKLEGKPNCTFKLYEGLGHFFNDKTGSIEPEVISDIAEFVKNCEK